MGEGPKIGRAVTRATRKHGTIVYGASDDLIEFEGDVSGEFGCYSTDDDEHGVLILFSDGTLIEAKYGKAGRGIWALVVVQAGSLFASNKPCADEDADPHSDVVTFNPGLKWAYAATKWEKVH